MFTTEEFDVGMRVELHPGTDRWMMGDRYGTVIKRTRKYVYVRMDRSGKTLKCAPHVLLPLLGRPVAIKGMGEPANVHPAHWTQQ